MAIASAARLIRDPKPVMVQLATPKSQPSSDNKAGDGDEQIIIVNEAYFKDDSNEITIGNEAFKISGTTVCARKGRSYCCLCSFYTRSGYSLA